MLLLSLRCFVYQTHLFYPPTNELVIFTFSFFAGHMPFAIMLVFGSLFCKAESPLGNHSVKDMGALRVLSWGFMALIVF